MVARGFALLVALGLTGPVWSQEAKTIESSVLVIDQDRLLAESGFGERLAREFEREAANLAQENRQIELALIREERELTEARPTMDPTDFRAAADAFDAKVTRIRSAQDRKSRALSNLQERERRAFLDAALPVFGTLLDDYGAYVLLDRRQIFLSDDRVDITDEAIKRVNAALAEMEPTLDRTPSSTPEIEQ